MDKIVYKSLQYFLDKNTKNSYELFLNEVICFIESIMPKVSDYLYKMIYDQLVDIRLNIVNSSTLRDYDEINERYNLGGLAIRNFDDDDDFRTILVNILRGALYYSQLPDK